MEEEIVCLLGSCVQTFQGMILPVSLWSVDLEAQEKRRPACDQLVYKRAVAPTCRFINAPSLVSPDLSFNEISILVFCCAFRGDMSLEVIQEMTRNSNTCY